MPRLLLLLLLALAACGPAPPRAAPLAGAAAASPTPAAPTPAPSATPRVLVALPGGEADPLAVAAVGEPFALALGEARALGDSGLSLSFSAVPEDSRCPDGARCIWQGRAVVALEVRAGAAPAEAITLALPGDLTPDAPELRAVGPYTLRLVDLAPYPGLAGAAPAPYVATLVLERP